MTTKKLMTPLTVGLYELRNRVVMAPLTRTRAGDRNIPREMNIVYYRQRANAGLIISEATSVSPAGYGYYGTPGIHTEQQRDAWKRITDAVHEEGGLIFLQLWHVGRISHQDLQPGGVLPVSASAIQARGNTLTRDGLKPHPTPRALTPGEMDSMALKYMGLTAIYPINSSTVARTTGLTSGADQSRTVPVFFSLLLTLS
jgi:N-ethylmaleimide reductase